MLTAALANAAPTLIANMDRKSMSRWISAAGTIAGNHFSAAMFDALGGYTEVWRVYTVAMLIALVPALALWRVGRVARRSALQGP